ncbi:uncharacterized protein [Ptychodera flava]|uniref:uncharacterized protein n=1 Tax=Ptychodera flava TaxID=63121 RepID=UPI00396A16C3
MTATRDRDYDTTEINRKYDRLKKDLHIHIDHWEKFCQQLNFFISVLKRPVQRKLNKDTYIDSTADAVLLKRLNLSRRYGVKNISEVKSFYIDYIKHPLTAPKAEVIAKYLVIIDQLREYERELQAIAREILKQVGEDQAINIDPGKVRIAHALNVELARLESLLKDDNDFSGLDKEGHKLAIGDMLEFGGVISLAPTIHDVVRGILKLISYLVSHSDNRHRYEVLFDMSHATKHSDRTSSSLPPLVHSSILPVVHNGDRYDSAGQYYESSYTDSRATSKATSSSVEGSKGSSKRKSSSSVRTKGADYGVGRLGNPANNTESNPAQGADIRTRKMAATVRKREASSAKSNTKPQDVTLLPPIHEHGVLGNSTQEGDSRHLKSRQGGRNRSISSLSDDDDDDDLFSDGTKSASDIVGLSSADSSTIQASVIEDLQRRVKSLEESSESMRTKQKLQFLISQGLSATATPEIMSVIKDHIGPDVLMVFGLALGLNIGDIAILKESHHKNHREQVIQLMLTWQRRQGQAEATLEKIIDALVQTGQRDVANACLDDLKLLIVDKKDRDY